MLGYADPIVRLEEAPDNVCIISIRPRLSLREIQGEIIFQPEYLWR